MAPTKSPPRKKNKSTHQTSAKEKRPHQQSAPGKNSTRKTAPDKSTPQKIGPGNSAHQKIGPGKSAPTKVYGPKMTILASWTPSLFLTITVFLQPRTSINGHLPILKQGPQKRTRGSVFELGSSFRPGARDGNDHHLGRRDNTGPNFNNRPPGTCFVGPTQNIHYRGRSNVFFLKKKSGILEPP